MSPLISDAFGKSNYTPSSCQQVGTGSSGEINLHRLRMDRTSKINLSRIGFRPLSTYIDRRQGVTGASKKVARVRADLSRRKGVVWVLIAFIVASSLGFAFAISPAMQKTQVTYLPHPVIEIHGPEQLDSQATDEGWLGNGTEENPYLITGWEVAALGSDAGIYVGNTTDHFIISNCYVHNASAACILLFNVTNATVIGNICENSQQGIDIVSSENVNVAGNNCTMAFDGIRVVASDTCNLTGNSCTGNLVGLAAHGSANITLESNTLSYNVVSGLHMNLTERSVALNNTCAWNLYGTYMVDCSLVYLNSTEWDDNRGGGLWMYHCYDVTAERNRARNSHDGPGLRVEGSGRCTLDGNTAEGCGEGIRCTGSDDCDIRDNHCSRNTGDGIRAESSGRLRVVDNECSDNGGHAVSSSGCDDGWIERNRCTGSGGLGVLCSHSSGCGIVRNTCTGNANGIRASGLTGGLVLGNEVMSSSGNGVEVQSCAGVNVSDNLLGDLDTGILFSGPMGASCTAYNNTVMDCVFGITIIFSMDLVLRNNVLIDAGIFFMGEHDHVPDLWTTHEIGPTNTVNGLPVLYLVSATGVKVAGAYGQVILADCSAVEVEGLDASNATVGIMAGFSDGITVRNSTCSDGYIGVRGWYSSVTVENTTCSRNLRSGIEMGFANACAILDDGCVDNIEYGIRLDGMYGGASRIELCDVSGSQTGIASTNGPSGDIVGNRISNCSSGIEMSWTGSPQLQSNDISNCEYGVRLVVAWDVTMAGNVMTGCGLFIGSDFLEGWNTHSIDTTNTVNGKPLIYLADESGLAVPMDAGQVVLANCSSIAIPSLNLSSCTVGVLAGFSDNVSVLGCTMCCNQLGICLTDTVDSQVLFNEMWECAESGVSLLGSERNALMNNSVTGSEAGISLGWSMARQSSWNNIASNNASGNTHGIVLEESPDNIVHANVLDSNLACGLMVGASAHTIVTNNSCSGNGDMAVSIWGSAGCTVANNTCSMNNRGVYLWSSNDCNLSGNVLYGNTEYGVCLDSSCAGNTVWDNVFAYNNGSADSYDPLHIQACDDGYNSWNTSDLPGGAGNYWHDWAAPDFDMDGIVDESYNITGSAGSRDYYPKAVSPMPIEPIPEFSALTALGLLAIVVVTFFRRKRD